MQKAREIFGFGHICVASGTFFFGGGSWHIGSSPLCFLTVWVLFFKLLFLDGFFFDDCALALPFERADSALF